MKFTKGGYDKGYGFANGARLTNRRGYADGSDYGEKPKKGSIIDMILHLDNLTLSYVINGTNYGKAFSIQQGKYRLGLSMRGVGDSLTLL